ncbi:hypothetical protein [Marispirochaeta sp.]|uniref:hypothetical protein n=1 Tax=Marispirochaeta sp. TaxID=2038653 RepID=UPI0029C91360|nr:hypothetical protein [Marispirochaeta sp.]
MKSGLMVPILLGIMMILLLYSLAFLFFLPYLPLPGGIAVVEGGRIHRDLGGDHDFRVIKIAHGLPRYHPLHQSLSQDFAAPLETAANLQLIVELYPDGSLGPEGQLLRGLEKGTLEICLIRGDTDSQSSLSLVTAAGPARHIWTIKNPLPENSTVLALREDRVVSVSESGFEILVLSGAVMQREARNGRFGYVDLDIFEWYHQDWSRWTESMLVPGFHTPQYRLLVNADFYESLDPAYRSLLREYAENFAARARLEVQRSEEELLSLHKQQE